MTRSWQTRAWRPAVVSLVLVAFITLAVAFLPFLRYAYRAPTLHVALNAIDAVIALVVGYLVHGRYRQTHRLRDLLLAGCMGVLAVANLPVAGVASAVDDAERAAWSSLTTRLLAASLFCAAAFVPPTRRLLGRSGRRWAAAVVAATALAVVAGLALSHYLAPPVEALPVDPSGPAITGHALVLVLQAASFAMYATAAVGFGRAAIREHDELLRWLGAAAVLGAGARVNYFLFPSLYSDYLYAGDVLRLGFYLLLVVGAVREIESYWSDRVIAAEARGRRGTVTRLEHLVLPELREMVRLARSPQELDGVAAAAGRVLSDVEQVLADVRREADAALEVNPFDASLRDALAPIAQRLDVQVDVRVEPDVDVPGPSARVIALACDLVRSAGRQAGARRVDVGVRADPLRLVVRDDGAGDDAAATVLRRLESVAAQHGATVAVTSTLLGGTTVTAQWE